LKEGALSAYENAKYIEEEYKVKRLNSDSNSGGKSA
jgi:hypothetical protein